MLGITVLFLALDIPLLEHFVLAVTVLHQNSLSSCRVHEEMSLLEQLVGKEARALDGHKV